LLSPLIFLLFYTTHRHIAAALQQQQQQQHANLFETKQNKKIWKQTKKKTFSFY